MINITFPDGAVRSYDDGSSYDDSDDYDDGSDDYVDEGNDSDSYDSGSDDWNY